MKIVKEPTKYNISGLTDEEMNKIRWALFLRYCDLTERGEARDAEAYRLLFVTFDDKLQRSMT